MSDPTPPKPQPSIKERDKDPRIDRSAATDDGIQQIHATLLREKEEPSEGYSPVPIALIFLFSALTFWGGVYIVKYSGGFNPMIYDETLDYAAMVDTGPAEIDLAVTGRRIYTRNCVACHQANGQGVPGAFPTLVDTDWVLGSEERLVRVLLHGLEGEIVVRGTTYNGVMPAFGNLSDLHIAAVLSFIRNEWGNEAPYIEEETVARIRSEEAGRTAAWSASELEPFVNP